MGRVTARTPVVRISGDRVVTRPDTLAVEEPLEMRVGGQVLAVTMRTPGNDVDLVHGFLLSEGVIGTRDDVSVVRYCDGVDETGANTYNVLDIALAPGVPLPDHTTDRNTVVSSACGVCGKTSLDAVRTTTRHPLVGDTTSVTSTILSAMPVTLRESQRIFERTGGLHAAGLFTATGELLALREDVGRHNAVDKVIGWAITDGRVPLYDTILIVSGRASFELVQKAVMAGIPILGAVSAPSSLAVELAQESGLTLAGFIRGDSMNVYSHPHRVEVTSNSHATEPTVAQRS